MSRTAVHIPKGTHMLPRAKYNTVGFHPPPTAGQIQEWRVYEPWSGVGWRRLEAVCFMSSVDLGMAM